MHIFLERTQAHVAPGSLRLLLACVFVLFGLRALGQGQGPKPLYVGSPALQFYSETNSLNTTSGPAIFDTYVYWQTNITKRYSEALLHNMPTNLPAEVRQRVLSLSTQTVSQVMGFTNSVFKGFAPDSLNYLVWTNFIAHTNGRTTRIWSERMHPPNWPTNPPLVKWDPQCLMWGMKGETALSPCWEGELYSGQIPFTALTRRHGYARGHDMGPDGFHASLSGKKVWFVTTNNTLVQATIAREVVRTMTASHRDYTIVLFKEDLPVGIEPMRVEVQKDLASCYPFANGVPWVIFESEQTGNVSANVPGFTVPTWKGGDSGSPNMLPLPGELVFCGGRSTSGASAEMQADMDELCRQQHLNSRKYQLQWVSLEQFPKY